MNLPTDDQRKWLFYLGAAVFAALVAIAAFRSPDGAWPLTVMAIACIVAANADQIREFSASTSGIQVSLNRAEIAVEQMRRLIRQNAKAQLALVQRGNRWDGFSEADREEILQSNIELMRDNGVSEAEIRNIQAKYWDPFIHLDYCQAITGGLSNKNMSKAEWEEYQEMTKDLMVRPTADQLEAFLRKMIVVDGLRAELLADYRYYRANGVSANPSAYRRKNELRNSSPQFIRELPQES